MKSQLILITLILGLGTLIIMSMNQTTEEIVTEPSAESNLSFDEKVAKIPYETATFGMGWFWGPDSQFGSINGVLRTRVGYCGGEKEDPEYYDMGDHTEAVSIDYDPKVISYSEVLDYFWKGHRCELNNSSVQYQNAVFYRDEKQKELAERALQKRAKSLGIAPENVKTKVIPVKTFTYAEKYHQKYAIGGEIREILDGLYPDAKSLANSTVTTRINAYLGSGLKQDRKKFLNELSEYGLPQSVVDEIRKRLER